MFPKPDRFAIDVHTPASQRISDRFGLATFAPFEQRQQFGAGQREIVSAGALIDGCAVRPIVAAARLEPFELGLWGTTRPEALVYVETWSSDAWSRYFTGRSSVAVAGRESRPCGALAETADCVAGRNGEMCLQQTGSSIVRWFSLSEVPPSWSPRSAQ
jgi:hypothetical protein